MEDFSEDYYYELCRISKHIHATAEKLGNDVALKEKFGGSLGDMNMQEFINYCMIYDLGQILKIINGDESDMHSNKAFGTSLLTAELSMPHTGSANPLPLENGYDWLREKFEDGGFLKVEDKLFNFYNLRNPIPFSSKIKTDDQIPPNTQTQIPTTLSLGTVLNFIQHPLLSEYQKLLTDFANILVNADGKVTDEEKVELNKVLQLIQNPLPSTINTPERSSPNPDKEETLAETLAELDSLVGLDEVKQEVKTLINFIKVQKARTAMGLKTSDVSYHSVFTGSPGTGKTTVARIVAKIFMQMGVLRKGHLIETERSGLVGEFEGQTAIKVNKTVDSALDGVLFIDEAYALVGTNQDDYGREAVATLIKRIEDDRDKLIVILAGYTDEMKKFIDTNPGFKSRFNRYVQFSDYSPSELLDIFELQCRNSDYVISPTGRQAVTDLFTDLFKKKDKDFGNGRLVRNIFEKAIENLSNRIADNPSPTKELLTTIEKTDIPEAGLFAN